MERTRRSCYPSQTRRVMQTMAHVNSTYAVSVRLRKSTARTLNIASESYGTRRGSFWLRLHLTEEIFWPHVRRSAPEGTPGVNGNAKQSSIKSNDAF